MLVHMYNMLLSTYARTHVCTCHVRTCSHTYTDVQQPLQTHRLPLPSATPCQAAPAQGARSTLKTGSPDRGERRMWVLVPGQEGDVPGSHTAVAEQVAAGPSLPTSCLSPGSAHYVTMRRQRPLACAPRPTAPGLRPRDPATAGRLPWTSRSRLQPPSPCHPAGSGSSADPQPPRTLPLDPSVFTPEFLGHPHLNVSAIPGWPHSHPPVRAAGGSHPQGGGFAPARPPSLPPHRVAWGSLCSTPTRKVVD